MSAGVAGSPSPGGPDRGRPARVAGPVTLRVDL